MATLHTEYCEHDQRMYEIVERQAGGIGINWTAADGLSQGAIGGIYPSEDAAMKTLHWFCQDPLVARGAKP